MLDQSEQLCRLHPQTAARRRFLELTPTMRLIAKAADGPGRHQPLPRRGALRPDAQPAAPPAAWKTDVVRKALAYYRPWWRAHKNTALVPGQTAAYAEAYLLTKEPAFADAVRR